MQATGRLSRNQIFNAFAKPFAVAVHQQKMSRSC